jgi:hypothetical protein
LVTPLTLPQSCPRATTCAVELTLRDGLKAAIISCYLPQTTEEHATFCAALTKLPGTLPHSLIIMGGIFKVDGTHHPQNLHTSQHYPTNDGKGPCSPPSYRARGPPRRHASTTSPSGTRKDYRSRRGRWTRYQQPFSITRGSWVQYDCPSLSGRTCPLRLHDLRESLLSDTPSRNTP